MYGIGKIYRITNLITGKSYIGQTIRKLDIRWSHHKGDAINNISDSYLHRSMRKWGIENFKIEWIASSINQEELGDLEDYFIGAFCPFAVVP